MVYFGSEVLDGDFAPRCMSSSGMPVSGESIFGSVEFRCLTYMPYRAAFQCLRALPSPPGKGLPRPATVSRLSSRNWQATCTFPRLDDRPNALAQSVAAGCEGFRTDIWLHDNEVQMGISRPVFQAAHDLHLSLDLLLTKLELRHTSADTQMPLNAETPDDKIENRAFMLVLDAKSPIHELYPHLISHLDVLRQRGYLTHWDGAQIVERPLTIVVTGQSLPDCSSSSYSDLFWSETAGGISADDIMNTHLLPICAI